MRKRAKRKRANVVEICERGFYSVQQRANARRYFLKVCAEIDAYATELEARLARAIDALGRE